MPNPVTEKDCQDCEQGVQQQKLQTFFCEQAIQSARTNVSGKVEGMKRYFADVESQMKNLQPDIVDFKKTLSEKYGREAELYKELHTESRVTAFLHRKDQEKRVQAGCPSECVSPNCYPGLVGGTALIGDKCTTSVSKPYGMFRLCGEGAFYTGSGSVRCSGCLEEVHVDRYMKCEEDRKYAEQELSSCNTKAKTVAMWNTDRQRQYKNKADVYIMRVARQSDPLNAQFKESARVDASIARMEKQVQDLKSSLPITTR